MNWLIHLALSSCWIALSLNAEVEMDQKEECPTKCSCSFSLKDSTIHSNCSTSGLKEIPLMSGKTTVLLMSKNDISQFDITWTERTVPNLHELYLDRNVLSTATVSHAILSRTFPDLQSIDLSYNKLNSLPRNLPPSLKTLGLGQNQIGSIHATEFSELSNLESLFLEGNIIAAIDELSFILPPSSPESSREYALQNLKHLELSNNSLRQIADYSFIGLNQLEALSLANNKLSHLTVNNFKGLRNLQYLDASYNELRSIQNQTFKQISSLKVLYLNNNYLQEVPQGIPFLDWADFSGNLIKFVNETLSKKDIYPIEMLNLASNPLHCDCQLLWLKELWDRREYLIEQSDNIDPENFIPVCGSPSSLHGELWTLLGDDVFTCDKKTQCQTLLRIVPLDFDEHLPDVSEFDQISESSETDDIDEEREMAESVSSLNNAFIQDYEDISSETSQKLKLEAVDVDDNSATITWQGKLPVHANNFFIRYHTFGQANAPIFVQVNMASTQIQLHGLRPQWNYIVCSIIPTTNNNFLNNVDLDDCIEITTKSSSSSASFPISEKTLDYHFKVLICSFMVSCIFCGIGLLVYEVVSRGIAKLDSSAKKKD